MRTTLTLDSDVARLIEEAMHRERHSLKQVINDALRRGLGHPAGAPQEPYELVPHKSSLRPGLDLSAFNRLADEPEGEEIVARAARSS